MYLGRCPRLYTAAPTARVAHTGVLAEIVRKILGIFLCIVFGLHYLYGYRHEGRRRLGNKNKSIYFVFRSACTTFIEARLRLNNAIRKILGIFLCIVFGLHYLCKYD